MAYVLGSASMFRFAQRVRSFSLLSVIALLPLPAMAQAIAAPAGSVAIVDVQGGGAQIYACRATPAKDFAWKLVGPKAILVNDDGSDFGTHGVGPAWTAKDGSSIVADGAHPITHLDVPNSVPELVLRVTSATGSGILTPARFVVRSDTAGGLPPVSGCDAAHENATVAR
jgi:Protein of unknown function (DUF3455)